MKKTKLFVQCTVCSHQVEVQVIEAKIINHISCSMILLEHPDTAVCSCGATVVANIAGMKGGFAFVGVAVPSDVPESRIIPATHVPPLIQG